MAELYGRGFATYINVALYDEGPPEVWGECLGSFIPGVWEGKVVIDIGQHWCIGGRTVRVDIHGTEDQLRYLQRYINRAFEEALAKIQEAKAAREGKA